MNKKLLSDNKIILENVSNSFKIIWDFDLIPKHSENDVMNRYIEFSRNIAKRIGMNNLEEIFEADDVLKFIEKEIRNE